MVKRLPLGGTVLMGILALTASRCEAAGFSFDRAMWDMAMRWINFGILVFVLYKYLKSPLVDFVRGRQEKVACVLRELEERAAELEAKRREQEELLSRLDEKIESIKAHYHEIGRQEKERILAQAEKLKEQILRDAEAFVLREFEEAKARFRSEVVDLAVKLAEDRLKKKMTKKDHKKLINAYVNQLRSIKARSAMV